MRAYQTGLVCVCNETFCDTLEFNLPSDDVLIISSSKSGLRFRESKAKFNSKRFKVEDGEFDSKQTKLNKKPEVNDISQQFFHIFNLRNEVSINHDETHQKIFGFGNAFTGTVSHILKSAPKLKENIYKSYFSKETGNAFNIIRMSIGGSDFDLEPWAYNELPENDPTLSNFTELDFRDVEKVSQIKELMIVTGNSDIKFVGAAWSSPKWMKTNNAWTGFGQLKEEYYQAWADYHVKYLELMHKSGIDFWAISTGNEPLNGVIGFLIIKFMSLGWLPRAQGKWVSENLGPALRKSSITSKVKLLAGDDQRYTFPWWFEQMYQSYPDSKNFVDGHAVHWYWDKYASPNLLERTRNQFPDKLILATEACSGDKPWEEQRPMLGYWPRCEDYTIDIIEDLNHHVNAWIDWNLLLDADGGPNYANNFVDSPIVVNTTSELNCRFNFVI